MKTLKSQSLEEMEESLKSDIQDCDIELTPMLIECQNLIELAPLLSMNDESKLVEHIRARIMDFCYNNQILY